MDKTFKKYLFFLIALLLSCFTNLLANNNGNTFLLTQNLKKSSFQTSENLSHSVCNPYQKENKKSLFAEITDVENTEENEEKITSNAHQIVDGIYLNVIFYSYLFEEVAYSLQEKTQRFKNYFSNTSLKLYTKFQVFII